MKPINYKDAGVDIAAGNRLVSRIKPLAASTHGPGVIGGIGGFASLFRLPEGLHDPLLVSCCDGVGTKLKLAFATGRHDTVGIDLVAMNVNDLLCCGAQPLFFLDYLATGKLQVEVAEAVVAGIAQGCRQAGCALIGGETAEMPGFYPEGEYDLAGFAVGVVERERVLDGQAAAAGDIVIGLTSSGLHSNGYSLARRALIDDTTDLLAVVPRLGCSLADALLAPTRIYAQEVQRLRDAADVRALVHVTGGGLVENPPRCIADSLAWRLDCRRWEVPPIIDLVVQRAQLAADEARRTFNMGLGMLAVVPERDVDRALSAAGDEARVVGEIVERGSMAVEFVQ
jgi:phosphoribosylformylglycinamidine cyclo-ligase